MMPKRGKPQVIDVDLSARQGKLRDFGGSTYDAWNDVIFKQVYEALWVGGAGEQPSPEQTSASAAGLRGIAPRDELEGMLAAQLIACHNASMECFRRAMIGGQTFEGQRESLNQANKLSRTYATLLEALNRHRGKGQQKVTVEHVHVHAGGQAVVGALETPGGGDRSKSEDQPHAKQIAHAPEPPMRSPDPAREPVPVTRDAERPLPDARRKVTGRA
jgi:hypothetical protein